MSQYAVSAENRYENRTGQIERPSITKNDPAEAYNNAQQPYKPPIWAKYVTFPEGVGAWAVILTLLTIAWQSIETRASVKAQIDGNRAWIFADLKKLNPSYSNGTTTHADGKESLTTYLLASLKTRNEGSSPAWIESVHGHMEILPKKQKPPKKVRFTLCPYVSTIMMKGEDVFNPEFECSGNLTSENDWLFIWMVIKYHDGHGIKGETSLGYAMAKSGILFRQNNLPERNYNK